jgi:non-ribosomal peptide synthetase component F
MTIHASNIVAQVRRGSVHVTHCVMACLHAKHDQLCGCRDDGIKGSISYATELFDASTVERMAQHFANLLAAVVSQPDVMLSELDIMGQQERQLTLQVFNKTAAAYPAKLTLPQLFEQVAARASMAACLVAGDTQLSYAAVNTAANQLAHWLVSRGVTAGCAVGVSLPKCPQLYIALLAVMKAGGYYVPLDPELPAERAGYMLNQTGVRLLLASASAGTAELPEVQVVIIDQGWERFRDQPMYNMRPQSEPTDLAYCIFTSGSTGQPKVKAFAADQPSLESGITYGMESQPLWY